MRRWLRQLLVTVLAVAVGVSVVVVVVRSSDGAFGGSYELTGSFAQAGHGLQAGSEVAYRGVQVGRVTTIVLHRGRAAVTMAINPSFRVPADAVATIEPINVFGADEVSLSFPVPTGGSALGAGGTIVHTALAPGLGSLFAAAAPLLRHVDTTDLSTVVANLAQASAGEGPTIRASIDEGAKLAAFLDQTLPAQIAALDSLNGFAGAIGPTAGSIDAISASANQLLPTFDANAAAYRALLADLTPFADNLAQFLSAYHPDIQALLANGDDIARLVLARQQDIGTLISGLAMYETKIGSAVDPAETLPNGSGFVYFDTFVSLGNLDQLVCSLLDPQLPGSAFLAPLQQALTGAGTPFRCGSPSAATAPSGGSGTTPGASLPVSQAARKLSTSLYGQWGAPSPRGTGSAGLGAPASPSTGASSGTGAAGTSTGGAGSGSSGAVPGSSGPTNVLRTLLGGLL
ncbi:MAG: MlaD family protein [Actinomycetota bacterium]|jgi:virulence factor Mce-like protein|nr:MlaD family protein [Actinomycetota bacterium]MDA8281145.1 MlaD family protein [Actinomycetota bacterium]